MIRGVLLMLLPNLLKRSFVEIASLSAKFKILLEEIIPSFITSLTT